MKKRNSSPVLPLTQTVNPWKFIPTDPQGSYTGNPDQPGEIPVQDADDL